MRWTVCRDVEVFCICLQDNNQLIRALLVKMNDFQYQLCFAQKLSMYRQRQLARLSNVLLYIATCSEGHSVALPKLTLFGSL